MRFWLVVLALASANLRSEEGLLTLEEALSIGLSDNATVAAARAAVESADAAARIQEASDLPNIDLGVDWSRSDNALAAFGHLLRQRRFRSDLDFNRPGEVDNTNLYLESRYRIYGGGTREAVQSAAEASRDAARHSEEDTVALIRLAIVEAYRGIQETEEAVDAARGLVSAYEASASVAREREEEGALLRSERLMLEVDLAEARQRLTTTESESRVARLMLERLLGRSLENRAFEDLPESAVGVREVSFDTSRLPAYRRARAAVEAARSHLRAAKGGRRPSVDAFARGDMDTGEVVDDFEESWTIGLRANVPVWSGGREAGKVRQAQAELNRQEALLRDLERALTFEYEAARERLREARSQLETASARMAMAEEAARISRERFEEGALLASQLRHAEFGLANARAGWASAKATVNRAAARLLKAAGEEVR